MVIEKSHLTNEQIEITQNCGTEPPFSGKLLNEKRKGIYICAVCKDILFDETAGTWWLIDIFVFYHVLGKLSNAIPGSWAPLVF